MGYKDMIAGDMWEVDLNNNGKKDLEIYLSKVKSDSVDISMWSVKETPTITTTQPTLLLILLHNPQ